ncbi:MAG TPA: bifunctional DNA primase/polymerase [Verrucomicrobiae bacterium]|nr:bifunctional DNA primase/polymerase [Verrucomicrobiae bacterium]
MSHLHKQNPQSTPDPVPELQELLGTPVVFIKWPRGVKANRRKWGYLTVEDMTPEYLGKLPSGNIGVALGEKSGGLCAIDLDDDKLVEPFLQLNPHLKATLQTRGARGRVFWLRFKSDYPKHTTKLKTNSGDDVGEFRSNGAQSIVWGIHPDTKRPYQFVARQKVVEVDLGPLLGRRRSPTNQHLTYVQKNR